jgi:hypothetical protein
MEGWREDVDEKVEGHTLWVMTGKEIKQLQK